MRTLIAAVLLALTCAACAPGSDGASGESASADGEARTFEPSPALAAVNARLPKVGSTLPAFSAATLDGRTVDNEAIAGKTALLNFWFKDCVPCRKELPELDAIHDGLAGRDDVVFYAVNGGMDEPGIVEAFWKDKGYGFEALTHDDGDTATTMGVAAFPTNIVVGPDGTVRWASVGFDEAAIKHHLGIAEG